MTVAGIIASKYGPYIGGFFLAFPAIFPASATLIEKHEKQRKGQWGLHGATRGILSAGVDAAGAQLGSLGMMTFGLVIFLLAPTTSTWQTLGAAFTSWAGCSVGAWYVRKKVFK